MSDPRHIRWPTDRFFWSVLEAPGTTPKPHARATLVPDGLISLLADDLPVPIDQVHAVMVPIAKDRVLVAAARSSELETLPSDTLSLTPASLPNFVVDALPNPTTPAVAGPVVAGAELRLPKASSCNLLIGRHEPTQITRTRNNTHLLTAGTLVLASGLISLGLVRRTEQWREASERAESKTRAAITAALAGDSSHLDSRLGTAGNTAPPDTFTLERKLQQAREAAAHDRPIEPPQDVTALLAAVLKAWPSELGQSAFAQSIGVTASGASLSVLLGEHERGTANRTLSSPQEAPSPAAFLSAMRLPRGWSIQEPRHSTNGSLTRISLRLRQNASDASVESGGTP